MATGGGFVQTVFGAIAPYQKYIILVVVAIALAVFGWWMYTTTVRPMLLTKTKQYDDVANRGTGDVGQVTIFFFHANWCPHCRKCTPDWESFSSSYNQKTVNGKLITCVDVNTEDESSSTTELAKKYNVSGIPYLIAVTDDGRTIELEGKITESNLQAFVESVTTSSAAASASQ